MKQIIRKNSDSSIYHKYYDNDIGQKHAMEIYYWNYNKLGCQINWKNDKEYGLSTDYSLFGEIMNHIYHL